MYICHEDESTTAEPVSCRRYYDEYHYGVCYIICIHIYTYIYTYIDIERERDIITYIYIYYV